MTAIRERMDELVPKHIIPEDILAAINYLNGAGATVSEIRTTSTIWETAVCALWASCCKTSSRIGFSPHGARYPRAHDACRIWILSLPQ